MNLFHTKARQIIRSLMPRSRPTQPGGHPTIPYGKIIAGPRADGGYSLYVYHGIRMGWIPAGVVSPGQDVDATMQNLARPTKSLIPTPTAPRPENEAS